MGCNLVKLLKDEEVVKELCDETGFEPNQLQRLYYRFCYLDQGHKGYITHEDFVVRLPELFANPLGERIMYAMYRETDRRKQEEEMIEEEILKDEVVGPLQSVLQKERPKLEEMKIPFKNFVRSFARFRARMENPADHEQPVYMAVPVEHVPGETRPPGDLSTFAPTETMSFVEPADLLHEAEVAELKVIEPRPAPHRDEQANKVQHPPQVGKPKQNGAQKLTRTAKGTAEDSAVPTSVPKAALQETQRAATEKRLFQEKEFAKDEIKLAASKPKTTEKRQPQEKALTKDEAVPAALKPEGTEKKYFQDKDLTKDETKLTKAKPEVTKKKQQQEKDETKAPVLKPEVTEKRPLPAKFLTKDEYIMGKTIHHQRRSTPKSLGSAGELKKPTPYTFCSTEGKAKFLFRMFDLDEDMQIDRAEVFALLAILFPNFDEVELLNFSEHIILESNAGLYNDGVLAFQTFCAHPDIDRMVSELYFRFTS